MRVFRRRQTLGLVALLALAMQVVLAFAETHTHTYGFAHAEGLAHRAITYGMCRADLGRPCPPPAQHDDHGQCSICGALSLAGAALPQAPPPLPLGLVPLGTPLAIPAVALVQGISTVHFQARAPPLA
jgi:hypothetical protein